MSICLQFRGPPCCSAHPLALFPGLLLSHRADLNLHYSSLDLKSIPHGHLLLAHHLHSQQVNDIASRSAENLISTHLCCTFTYNRHPSTLSLSCAPSSLVPAPALRTIERFASIHPLSSGALVMTWSCW